MIKALIFDFDGTMSNRQANAYYLYDEYLRPYFKDLSDIEYEAVLQDMMIYDGNGIIKVRYRIKSFLEKYKEYLPSDFEEKFGQYFLDNIARFTVLKPETIDLLNNLKKDYKIALLSNGSSDIQHNKIDHVLLNGYFDEVIVSGDYGYNKPDKRIYEITAEKLGVKKEECLFIGDTFSTDILGAIRANMIPVWINQISERPAKFYTGYRIENLNQIYDILNKENSHIDIDI